MMEPLSLGSSSKNVSALNCCCCCCCSSRRADELPAVGFIKLLPSPKLKNNNKWKRSQWSRGDAPGEYGGPPLDARIRQSYGKPEPNPLTTSADYIWNTKWQPYLDSASSVLEESLTSPSEGAEPETGYLSLNRAISLESLDVDLSKELLKPSKATLQGELDASCKAALLTDKEKADSKKIRWRFAPTRREEAYWQRAQKAASGGTTSLLRDSGQYKEDLIRQKQKYNELKTNLQLLTASIGLVGGASAWLIYTPEITASYGAGLLGAIIYIRMLGNSVDAVGSRDAGRALRGAMGQPRLLVPVLLVMFHNRWNELMVQGYGAVHLQLIPMLVGFFTYKVATVVASLGDLTDTIENS